MSTHASTKIDQKEYLKRYLSGDTNKKKKKKEKKHKRKDAVKVKVIDDDAIASTDIGIDEELLLTGDDAPQIVGTYIEEAPEPAEKKWKSIVIKDEPLDEDVKPIKKPDEDLWGPKESSRRIKDEFSPQRRERKSPTPDISPPRKRSSNKYRCRDEKDHEQCSRKIRSRSRDRKKKKLDDSSPPRRERNSTPTRNSDRDTSPVRNRGKKSKINKSPPNRRRKSNSFDQSPPRRRRNSSSLDQSPPRRRRKSESSDQSPPRRGRKRQSSDESPPRRKTKKLSKSPEKQRNQRIKRESPDQSPLRLKQRHSPNMSPTLRTRKDSPEQSRRRRKSSSDQSPPRRDTYLSPRRMEAPRISPSNIKIERISPVRMRNTSRERDHRTDRNIRGSSQQRSSRWQPREPSRSLSPPPTHMKKATKTLDGKKAGLQDAQTLKLENMERRRKEDDFYANMSTEMSGRDAEVQIRNSGRRGRRAKAAEELDPEAQRKKEIREAEKKERYDRWGKGLKQIEEHRAKINEQQYEANKPLARYSNDEDLDRHLRNQERADDPMLEYMREKKKEKQKHENVAIMPTYQGPYPENRFGIRPGYRWDGVDRSNGYEKKWFDVQSEKRAIRDEAYKYSVEDM